MTSGDDEIRKITETVDLISKKWHPIIIHRLHESGQLRFNELSDRIEGISAKVLTDSLNDLVENGLIDRIVVSESPKRVEYELTDDGRDLQSALTSLAAWGDRYLDPDPDPTVLIVDDDPRLARMYASWLEDDYEVKQVYNGEDGLRELTDDVDVVLLDRRMPGLSGEEVLRRIREFGFDTRVVILSAVEPDFDIIDMGFDAYVLKPGVKEEIHDVITEILTRDSYSELTQEYLVLNAKRALLEAEMPESELREREEYRRLLDRLEELTGEIDDPTRGLESNDRLVSVLEHNVG